MKAGNPQSQPAFSPHGLSSSSSSLSSSEGSQLSTKSTSSSSSSTSSRSSATTNEASPNLIRYTLTDNPVRVQPPRQPTHRSKLSKQYAPSDSEDSDDEPLGLQSARQSTYMPNQMAGQSNIKYNNSGATESLRDTNQTFAARSPTPVQIHETVNTPKNKALTSKLSLAKRISRLFGGKSSKKPSSSIPSDTTTSTSDTKDTLRHTKMPSMEIINDVSKQEPQSPTMYSHQRSYSTPVNATSNPEPTISQDQRGTARENSLDIIDVSYHRHYSNSTGPSMPSTPTTPTSSLPVYRQQYPPDVQAAQYSSRSLVSGIENIELDQPRRSYSQEQRSGSPILQGVATSSHSHNSSDNTRSNSPIEDHLRVRRSTVNDASPMLHVAIKNAAPRRSSTPLVVSETLVSKIDREKSTVCFQIASAKKDTYSRDANLDPALTSLVQQHRKDYQTNIRLGGVPEAIQPTPHVPTQNASQSFLPQIHSSPLLINSMLPARRDSGIYNSPTTGPHQTQALGGLVANIPGTLPIEAHARRYSASQAQATQYSPTSESKGIHSGNHSNLLNAAAMSSIKQQMQQQQHLKFQQQQIQQFQTLQQPSPQLTPQGSQPGIQVKQRVNQKRHSSSSYFNISPQQRPQSFVQQSSTGAPQASPFPSPILGATGGYAHELSIAMQHQQYQQQQVQFQIQQQQLQQLQQQQQVIQQQTQQFQVSPLTLLQNQSLQQQQNQQQLDQIRIQQQQLLLQQQQQLQKQLELAQAAIATPATTPVTTAEKMTSDSSSQQQQQLLQQQMSLINQSMPLHYALPAPPVLTTAMGMGVGMGMNPLNVNVMGMGVQQPAVIPQLVMTPQISPQLLGYAPTMYTYQQIPAGTIPSAGTGVVAGSRNSTIIGY
ncbi:hypothetical protein FBU30_007734 [Linnemannia zychae]|nr:hypothetical protein FBU30_007734 [Linnemannia zychae]